jgi:hypothetical protein
MTDMPMTSPGAWGPGKPKNLQEALAKVRASLDLVDTTLGKVKSPAADHVARIKDAAEGLLDVLNISSTGQQVKTRVAQFDAGIQASKTAVNRQLDKGDMSVAPAGALLGSVADLNALAQNL